MRIIPVLDIKAGRAVHAVAGNRAHYEPLKSVLHEGCDPFALARAYREVLGLSELYVADLDAIEGRMPNNDVLRNLARLAEACKPEPPSKAMEHTSRSRGEIWLDLGVRDRCDLSLPVGAGAWVVILGLETLGGPRPLQRIMANGDPDRIAFSLDLREGSAMMDEASDWDAREPLRLADFAVTAGIRRLLLLDLARIGTGSGTGTLGLLVELRGRFPELEIIVGGGVAGPHELPVLQRAGASAVLLGSTLHDGRIGREVCMAYNL
jgi:phosphoribosylformimino-5-aminoimidazole carboxamide ribotide isomerase